MASSFTAVQHQQQQQQQHHHHHHHQSPQLQQTSSNLDCRDLKIIASTFVKQYYTLLNKAPCFIHNFYNHDSTFIHGTIEMGSENNTEPVVGRERIEDKMKELKLIDCRAKIKQIDCLETLAGGLVIQVIGELSNNGKPLRRFMQTFVLAPSPDQIRHDGDPHAQTRPNDNRRGVQLNENSANSSNNQKFYVLNSIFRYQDDGPDSEFEDDSSSVQANTSVECADESADQVKTDDQNTRLKTIVVTQTQNQQQPQQQIQNQPATAAPIPVTPKPSSKQPASVSEHSTNEQKRGDTASAKNGASNGIVNLDKKSETSEKSSTENGKFAPSDNQSQAIQTPSSESGAPTAASQTPSMGTVTTPASRPSKEPKTWANMVRNALPPSATIQQGNVTATKEQPSTNQSSSNQAQNPSQQQQIPHHNQQSSPPQNDQHQSQQNSNNSNSSSNNNNTNNNNNNNNNNRRRHMNRKTSNKSGNGRTIKNRPRPAAPVAPASKPAT